MLTQVMPHFLSSFSCTQLPQDSQRSPSSGNQVPPFSFQQESFKSSIAFRSQAVPLNLQSSLLTLLMQAGFQVQRLLLSSLFRLPKPSKMSNIFQQREQEVVVAPALLCCGPTTAQATESLQQFPYLWKFTYRLKFHSRSSNILNPQSQFSGAHKNFCPVERLCSDHTFLLNRSTPYAHSVRSATFSH